MAYPSFLYANDFFSIPQIVLQPFQRFLSVMYYVGETPSRWLDLVLLSLYSPDGPLSLLPFSHQDNVFRDLCAWPGRTTSHFRIVDAFRDRNVTNAAD